MAWYARRLESTMLVAGLVMASIGVIVLVAWAVGRNESDGDTENAAHPVSSTPGLDLRENTGNAHQVDGRRLSVRYRLRERRIKRLVQVQTLDSTTKALGVISFIIGVRALHLTGPTL